MKKDDPFKHIMDTSDTYVSYIQAIQMIFRVHPVAASTWILSQGLEVFKDTVEAAIFIEGEARRVLRAVPDPPQDSATEDESECEDAVKEAILQTLFPGDISIKRISMPDIAAQLLSEGGLPIQLMLRYRTPTGKSNAMILALHLPEKADDGSETPQVYVNKMGWEMQAFEEILDQGFMGDESRPLFFYWIFCPLYLWPGTGLKDPGDKIMTSPDMSTLSGIFAENDKQRQERLARNRKIQQGRLVRMEDRLAAARAREALMGSAGITADEIQEIYTPVDFEKAHINFAFSYPCLRLWETPVETLLETLPAGAMGLALFGYRPAGFSDLDVLRQCIWRFRQLVQDLDNLSYMKAMMTFFYCANVFIPREEIEYTMSGFGLGLKDLT